MHTPESRARAYEKVKQRRRIWLEQNGPCVICGSWSKLEVDHIDPNLKVDHRIWSWADERRNAELEKCQVLCQIHHQEKTFKQRVDIAYHGGESMYKYYGCRCWECREGRKIRKRENRIRRKRLGLVYQ